MTLQYPRNDARFVGCRCEASEATKHTEVVGVAALKAEKFLKTHVLLSGPFSCLPPPIRDIGLWKKGRARFSATVFLKGFEERWIVHKGVAASGHFHPFPSSQALFGAACHARFTRLAQKLQRQGLFDMSRCLHIPGALTCSKPPQVPPH